MLRIGLTGGLGSGKSTVARLFFQRGVPVIDADVIARRLTAPGQPALRTIVETFGNDIASSGVLDRRRLAERVFRHPSERQRLEAILHPPIRAALIEEAGRLDVPYCLLVIPLLLETGLQEIVDRILVVDADEATQIQRIRERDRRSAEEIHAMLAAQIARPLRLAQADDVISNSGTVDELDAKVESLHQKYLKLAGAA